MIGLGQPGILEQRQERQDDEGRVERLGGRGEVGAPAAGGRLPLDDQLEAVLALLDRLAVRRVIEAHDHSGGVEHGSHLDPTQPPVR